MFVVVAEIFGGPWLYWWQEEREEREEREEGEKEEGEEGEKGEEGEEGEEKERKERKEKREKNQNELAAVTVKTRRKKIDSQNHLFLVLVLFGQHGNLMCQ